MQEDEKVLKILSGNIVVTDSISVAKLKFIGINKRIKAAGDEPLPYKFRIKFFVFYTDKPKFKRSG